MVSSLQYSIIFNLTNYGPIQSQVNRTAGFALGSNYLIIYYHVVFFGFSVRSNRTYPLSNIRSLLAIKAKLTNWQLENHSLLVAKED